jgi:hypothetical protein
MAYTLTAQDKLEAQSRAQQILGSQQPTQKKGNFLTSLLPTAGGILGGIGGSLLAPGLGTAAGGAAGAGFGKVLQNMFEGNKDVGQGVLGEAAFGTLGGVGKGLKAIKGAAGALKAGQGLSRAAQVLRFGAPGVATAAAGQVAGKAVPRMVGKAGKAIENIGSKSIGSQSLMTAAQARAKGINPTQVFGNINKRTGLTNMDDMAEVARGLTGKEGSMLDMLTREAVSNTTGVKIPSLTKAAQSLVDSGGAMLTSGQRKAVISQANRAGTTMYGGASGSLSTLANPNIALDQANLFRGNAKMLTSSFNPTSQDKQLAKIYSSLANTIESSLYKAPGVNQSIPTLVRAGSDDLIFKARDLRAAGNEAQARAYEKIAKDLRGVKDVKELRTFKKDFVDISKIDTASAQAEGARGINPKDFSIRSIIANNAAAPVGGKLIQAGQALQAGNILPKIGLPGAAKIAGTQLLGRSMTGNLPGASQQVDTMSNTGQILGQTNTIGGANMSSATGGLSQGGGQVYTQEAVTKDIQNDLQRTGGANMDKYITLYNFLNPKSTASANYSKPSSQQYSMATGGMTGVDQMAQMLSQDPSILTKTAIPGQELPIIGGLVSNIAGTGTYNAQAQNVLDSLARARTGAAMPASEKAFYERLLPRAGDSPETVQNKLALLKQSFEPFLGYGTTDSNDAATILSQMGL